LKDPYKSIYNNFVSTLNVLEYARTKNIRFVYAGSSSFHHGLYESPYAWSKFSGEDLCKLYSSVYGIDTAICRFYNVYGQYQLEKGTYATVMGIFENQFRNKEPLTIVGTGEQRRDFTHVDDIVDGLIKCSKQPFRGEIFELGSGVNYSINEITDMFGKDYPKKYMPKRSGEYDVTLADYTLANKVLNWAPIKNIKTYIEKIV
jgi:UDP-glucose 4-epimerase